MQLRDGLLQQLVGQMVQALGHGQPHGGAQDAAGLSRQSLGGLTQDLQPRVGEQGVLAARVLQGVPMSCAKRSRSKTGRVHAHLDAAGQRRIGRALQGGRQGGVAHQPHADQVARVEGEVQERGEVAEEVARQVLRLVDDPDRRDLLLSTSS